MLLAEAPGLHLHLHLPLPLLLLPLLLLLLLSEALGLWQMTCPACAQPSTQPHLLLAACSCAPACNSLLLPPPQVLAADTSDFSLSRANLPAAELSLSYLDLLGSMLVKRGLHCNCLPLLHLQLAISKLVIKSEVGGFLLMDLVFFFQDRGLSSGSTLLFF